jgi:hypothetical protein
MTDDNQARAGQLVKTKKPKRWTPNRPDLRHHSKDGHYVGALVNLEVATALGEFITYRPPDLRRV